MVGCITYILFTTCLAAQQGSLTFIVAMKTMGYFISFCSREGSAFVSNIYAATKLIPRITTFSAPWPSFKRIQLRSHKVFFKFFSTSVRYYWRR